MLFIVMVLVLLLGVGFVQISASYSKNQMREQEVVRLEKEILSERQRQVELLKQKEFMNTREFIEDVARDKLNLLYEDEIVFKTEPSD